MTGKSRGPELVRSYYRTYDEWGRLVRDSYHELELSTTLHYLRRYLPPRGLILDAGGGPGRYSIELARRGYRMVLLDFTPELLNKARGNTRRAGVASRVRQGGKSIVLRPWNPSDDSLSPIAYTYNRAM